MIYLFKSFLVPLNHTSSEIRCVLIAWLQFLHWHLLRQKHLPFHLLCGIIALCYLFVDSKRFRECGLSRAYGRLLNGFLIWLSETLAWAEAFDTDHVLAWWKLRLILDFLGNEILLNLTLFLSGSIALINRVLPRLSLIEWVIYRVSLMQQRCMQALIPIISFITLNLINAWLSIQHRQLKPWFDLVHRLMCYILIFHSCNRPLVMRPILPLRFLDLWRFLEFFEVRLLIIPQFAWPHFHLLLLSSFMMIIYKGWLKE